MNSVVLPSVETRADSDDFADAFCQKIFAWRLLSGAAVDAIITLILEDTTERLTAIASTVNVSSQHIYSFKPKETTASLWPLSAECMGAFQNK